MHLLEPKTKSWRTEEDCKRSVEETVAAYRLNVLYHILNKGELPPDDEETDDDIHQ